MPWAPIPTAWPDAMAIDAGTAEAIGTLMVFAREPIPGRVKTRLISALGAEGAASLYRDLLKLALAAAAALPDVRRELWCDGAPPRGGVCARLALEFGMALRHQGDGDLGARMSLAMTEALQRTHGAVLIGSDCPGYHVEYLSAALAALQDHDAVLGPAADGGYVLIGLRRPAPSLFTGIPWGTDAVLEQTRAALRHLGWTWAELPTLSDLDRPEDLAQLPAELLALIHQSPLV